MGSTVDGTFDLLGLALALRETRAVVAFATAVLSAAGNMIHCVFANGGISEVRFTRPGGDKRTYSCWIRSKRKEGREFRYDWEDGLDDFPQALSRSLYLR